MVQPFRASSAVDGLDAVMLGLCHVKSSSVAIPQPFQRACHASSVGQGLFVMSAR
jgi:hypothetical protein